jgi:hypothetical protein
MRARCWSTARHRGWTLAESVEEEMEVGMDER